MKLFVIYLRKKRAFSKKAAPKLPKERHYV